MEQTMLENMTFEELARETMRSDDKLAAALLEKCEEALAIERSGAEALQNDIMGQLNSCLTEMNGMLQELINDLIAAKGAKRKSQDAIHRFQDRCENMPSDYSETFSVLWDIDDDD